jgi:hypothetical protein
MDAVTIIQKIPLLTTVLSAMFAMELRRHWIGRGRPAYLFWWMVGVVCYGLGTLTESWVAVAGWSEPAFKSWYILGALLGGFPLAQGSVYLMLKRKSADVLMWVVLGVILVAAVLVLLSPIRHELVEPTRLTGKVLGWTHVRLITPVVNLYAFVFLVGGALYSVVRYSRNPAFKKRFYGNLFIAAGGLLPGIGGSFTKLGYTEVLYVTELIGIVLIYMGYRTIRADQTLSVFTAQQAGRGNYAQANCE